jgi:hypothetical protein
MVTISGGESLADAAPDSVEGGPVSYKVLTIKIFLWALMLPAASFASDIFQAEHHCVAWKAKKVMYLVNHVEPVGRNCSIESRFRKADGQKWRLEVSAPIEEFDSGEPDRDKSVYEILRGDVRPALLIQSQPLESSRWQKIWQAGTHNLKAEVWLGETSYPVNLNVQATDGVLMGEVITDFSHFDIEPPTAFYGLVTEVKDYLELHYHLQKAQVQNSDWLTD